MTISAQVPHADAVLSDGSIVEIRAAADPDRPIIEDFCASLSDESLQSRYFHARGQLTDAEIDAFVHGPGDSFTLIAANSSQVAGLATYDREPDTSVAEVSFLVRDEFRLRGVGTLLLEHLAAHARKLGVTAFVAHALAGNRRMRDVFANAGYAVEETLDGDVLHITLDLEQTEFALDAIGLREQVADARSLVPLLRPRSIAVVGAGRKPGTIGHEVFRALLMSEFNGPVYPVNPVAEHVAGVRAYPTIADLPGPVDLVVVTVPAAAAVQVVEQAGQAGVLAAVVISAGFAECGDTDAEARLTSLARHYGMRLVGPNCMGVLNTAADVRMNATFAPDPPASGRIGLLSQSGALGIAVLSRAARNGIGISTFVSVGNKADVSGNDMLQYWESDPDTDVVLLYLESFGNPRKFARIARRVGQRKPIVAVKSGRTAAGSTAAQSHTAAAATPDVAVDALFRQSGVIRVDTLGQLFDVARLLTAQPLPHGNAIAIVGNAGGPGILAADASSAAGLTVPALPAETQQALRAFLPSDAAVTNPVDMVAAATPAAYRSALTTVLADTTIDSVLVICTPTQVTDVAAVAAAIREVAAETEKTVVACFVGLDEPPVELGTAVPSYAFPEPAVMALGLVAAYAAWRERTPGTVPELAGVDRRRAQSIVSDYLTANPDGGWLSPADAVSLVRSYGIDATESVEVRSPDGAAAAAAAIGGRIVLKASGPELVHKSDVGGVRLGLTTPEEIRAAYVDMGAKIGPAMTGAVVQRQLPAGIETVVGVNHDESFGPLVMFGLGGVTMNLLGDTAFRVLPVTDADAAELVRSLRGSPVLFGYRGTPAVDVPALEDLLVRTGKLAGDIAEIAELDLNPVIVGSAGVAPVDVKVRIAPRSEPDAMLRRLR
ncbi:MAG: GNAT family N-acetyltransferase [Actinomycetota bacterium]